MIAFVLPNKGSSADLRTFVVTVDKVEELTGLDFFQHSPTTETGAIGAHNYCGELGLDSKMTARRS